MPIVIGVEKLTWFSPTTPPSHRFRVHVQVSTGKDQAHVVRRGSWDARTSTWRDMEGYPIPTALLLGWSEWPNGPDNTTTQGAA